MNIEDLKNLPWGKARNVTTKAGQKSTRSATATPAVLDMWNSNRAALYALGYSVGEWNGETTITKWDDPISPSREPKKDKLAKSNVRDLIRKYTPKGPMKGFLFGRSADEVQAILRGEREAL